MQPYFITFQSVHREIIKMQWPENIRMYIFFLPENIFLQIYEEKKIDLIQGNILKLISHYVVFWLLWLICDIVTI